MNPKYKKFAYIRKSDGTSIYIPPQKKEITPIPNRAISPDAEDFEFLYRTGVVDANGVYCDCDMVTLLKAKQDDINDRKI